MRRPALLVAGIILAVGGFYAGTLREGHAWGDDFSLYIAHAKNLAEGQPYAETGYLYNPANPIGPAAAPPVFPALLASVYRTAGLNFTALKLVPVACFLAALGMIYLVVRRRLSAELAVLLVAAIGFNPLLWAFKDEILSDFPFLFFAYLSFFCIDRTTQAGLPGRRQAAWALATGASIYLAAATREVGLLILPAWWAADLLRARRLTRPALLAAAACAGLLALQALLLPELATQGGRLGQAPQMIRSHFSYYSKELRDLWRNGYGRFFMRALFLTINGLGLWGYIARWRRGPSALDCFPILYVAVVLLWPDYQGIRYLFPVVPLYLLYGFAGLEEARRVMPARGYRWAAAALLGTIFLSYAARYTTLDFGPIPEGIARPDAQTVFAYLRRDTPPDSVLVCAKPRAFALMTGRRAAVYALGEEDEGLRRDFERIGADYAITHPVFFTDVRVFRPVIDRHPEWFEPVFVAGEFRVYRIRPRTARSPR